ncbi:MAG: radical SAM protein [Candidatus Omnitrophota bacterium]
MNKTIQINFILTPLPFLGDPKRNAPLGVMYLAAVTEKNGFSTIITDIRDRSCEDSLDFIPQAKVYAFSSTTPEYPIVREVARRLKARQQDCLIILGGVHATVCFDSIDSCFDVVAVGEGEKMIIEILLDYEKGQLKNRIYRGSFVEELSLLPHPARHLVSKDAFVSHQLVEKGKPATTILGSRGCAFACSFCASKLMWHQKCRFRDPENIIEEIIELKKRYGVQQLRFQDDALEINRPWLEKICSKIKPLGFTWRANARINTTFRSKDILPLMKEAGCDELCYGIESPEQFVLDKCNKNMLISQAYEVLRLVQEAGMKVRIFLIIGLPGQDKDVAKNMIAFIEQAHPSAVDLSTFVPFPGCDIYHNAAKYGVVLNSDIDFNDYVMTRGLYGNEKEKDFVFKHDKLANEQLKDLRAEVLEFIQSYNLVQNK